MTHHTYSLEPEVHKILFKNLLNYLSHLFLRESQVHRPLCKKT
uniref:Uncharacterized protein n=1 Tax=Anguilla anguilla TaxID=7936 RepID=A0A0E9VZY3_ANGAN